MSAFLSIKHRITEKGMMEFLPFGTEADGTPIRDLSGVVIRASVDHLKEVVGRKSGEEAGRRAVEELVRRLNERIPDRAYHVTAEFLRNPWNSYSNEFTAFLAEFCIGLSGDRKFYYSMAREQAISPIIQILGRPFSVPQIYRMSSYFAQRFAKESFYTEAVQVSAGSAIIQMRFSERAYYQFGPYRRACAEIYCGAHKGYFVGVPERFHGLSPAAVTDRRCIAEGDDCCEWEVTWSAPERRTRPMLGWVAKRLLYRELEQRQKVIDEQARSLDAWQEELKEAYVRQQRLTAELQRRVDELTTLHEAALLFTSTLDRDTLIERVLQTIVKELNYDRVMIILYDRSRQVAYHGRIIGVSEEVAAFARSIEIPVTDPDGFEGTVFLKGEPILIPDLHAAWDRLHPLNRRLAMLAKVKSILSVPLKVKNTVLGALTVDRAREPCLTQEDVNLMTTVAGQVTIALDNANAYRQIEELNIGLEAKVRERTQELERSDRHRSMFLSHVSHELRTPLTSIKGFVDNLLSELAGPLTVKQHQYLTRTSVNVDRLIRMIADLLDRTRIESGKLELQPAAVDIRRCVTEVLEQLGPLAMAKGQRLDSVYHQDELVVWADADRLTQILTNLIHNAIKFTPEEGTIVIRAGLDTPNFVGVTVSDTGPGIPFDAQDKVFDPFFRIGRERSRPIGLGLGLSIVKTLVELHGGVLSVQSQPGRGAEFHFTIPVSQTEQRTSSLHEMGKRLLIVDDDPDIRQLLEDRLGSYGFNVKTAADGNKALEVLRAGSFDGVILDIGMPDVDGLDVLRQIRERDTGIPIIMVTASGSRERAIQAVGLGAQDYLLKPFGASGLREIVERWFGQAPQGVSKAILGRND